MFLTAFSLLACCVNIFFIVWKRNIQEVIFHLVLLMGNGYYLYDGYLKHIKGL